MGAFFNFGGLELCLGAKPTRVDGTDFHGFIDPIQNFPNSTSPLQSLGNGLVSSVVSSPASVVPSPISRLCFREHAQWMVARATMHALISFRASALSTRLKKPQGPFLCLHEDPSESLSQCPIMLIGAFSACVSLNQRFPNFF